MAEMSALQSFTPRQRRTVALLVADPSMTSTALAGTLGVSERTIRRWLAMPAFRDAIDEAVDLALSEQMRRLKQLVEKALDVLALLLTPNHPLAVKASWATRVRAAQVILAAVRDADLSELIGRVAALEAGH